MLGGLTALDLLQAVTDGLLFGATYAIIGTGFALIFGVMHKINLAYAATAIAGAYVSLAFAALIPMPAIIVFLIAAVASGAVGYLIYLTCFRFIPTASPLATLMATVGMLILIDEVIVHETDGMPQPYPALFNNVMIEIGNYGLRGDLIFIFGLSVVATVALVVFLFRTRLGVATRAVAQQPVAAQLCGISVQRTNGTTFIMSGLLGGLAGAMTGAAVGTLSPLLTLPITVKGLIVTVIGGLGSIPGAIIAGLLVGMFENVALALRDVQERDLYVMLLLFVFLAIRPRGIFGKSAARD